MENFGRFIAKGALSIIVTLIQGFVLMWLWRWFIVPLGVKVLTIPWAVGVALLVHYMAGDEPKSTKLSDAQFLQAVLEAVIYALIMLGIGYVFHRFM